MHSRLFFLLKKSDLRVSPSCISRSPKLYLSILKQGMPSFFRQGILSLSTMALNFNAKIYGDAAVAALAIVTKVFTFIQSIVIGFGQGFQPVLGYNYGAGRLDRVKEAVKFSVKTCTIILTVCAVVGFAFAPQIVTLFRDDLMVIDIGTRAFRYQCFTLPLGAVLTFANMFFQSLGKSVRPPSWPSAARACSSLWSTSCPGSWVSPVWSSPRPSPTWQPSSFPAPSWYTIF